MRSLSAAGNFLTLPMRWSVPLPLSRLHLGADAPLDLGEIHRCRRSAREPALDLRLECLGTRIQGQVLLLERSQGGADHIVRRAVAPTGHFVLHQPLELCREMNVHMCLPTLPIRFRVCNPAGDLGSLDPSPAYHR